MRARPPKRPITACFGEEIREIHSLYIANHRDLSLNSSQNLAFRPCIEECLVLQFVEKLLWWGIQGMIGFAMLGNYIYHFFFSKGSLRDPKMDDPRDEWFQL